MADTYWDSAKIIDQVETATRPTGAIDDFEDGDLSEYSNTVDATVQSTTVYEGTYAVEFSGATDAWHEIITSQSGLPRYPQAGDTFQYRYRSEIIDSSTPAKAAQGLFSFGVQGTPTGATPDDGYYVIVRPEESDIQLQKIVGGSNTQLAVTTYSTPAVQWFIIEVDWGEGGSITATLKDENGNQIAQISATDSTFTDGGISFNIFSREGTHSGFFDIAELTATTSSTGAIDDFNDGDLSEYTGVTGDWSPQTTTVFEGSHAIEVQDTGGGTSVISSLSGLPRYPQRGDTFSYRTRIDTSVADNALIEWASSADFGDKYGVLIDIAGGSFDLRYQQTELASDTITWSNHELEWLEVVIDFQDTITVTLNDSAGSQITQISATDTSRDGGGIRWGAKSGTAGVYFDIAEITATADQSETGTIDDFEDGDMSEYSIGDGFGSAASYPNGATTTRPFEGSYSFEVNIDNTTGSVMAESLSGLDRYPESGDTFEWYWYIEPVSPSSDDPDGVNDLTFGFGTDGFRNNEYRAIFDNSNGNIELAVFVGGSFTSLASTSVTVPVNEWVRCRVDWGADGNIVFTLYDSGGTQIGQVSATDTSHSSGGINAYISQSRIDDSHNIFLDSIEII